MFVTDIAFIPPRVKEMDKLRPKCSLVLTHQIKHNDMFYNNQVTGCVYICQCATDAQLQLIHLRLKNIRYYRLMITRDKIHEVIQISVG